jgi:peroxiredoxin
VAVSVDPSEVSLKMKGELHLDFPLLSDPDEKVIGRYGLVHAKGNQGADIARPADLLLDGQGVIRWALFTDDYRIRAHPDALLAAARQLR